MCKIGSPLLSFLLCSLCTPLQTIKKSIRLDDNVEIKFNDTVDDINNLIEKGYDKEKKKKYYKIYYNDED